MGKNLHIHFEDDVSDKYLEDLQKKIQKVIKGEDVLGAEVEGQSAFPNLKAVALTTGYHGGGGGGGGGSGSGGGTSNLV